MVPKNDRWYACFECERAVWLPATNEVIGVDRGVHVLAALSDGRLLANAAVGEKCKAATARTRRELEAVTMRDRSGRVINGAEHRHGDDVIALEKLHLRAMTRSVVSGVVIVTMPTSMQRW